MTKSRCLVPADPWPGNANADPLLSCAFKKRMTSLISDAAVTTVIDIHGMRDDYGVDVCIGTHTGTPSPLATVTASVLGRYGLSCSFDTPFAAAGHHTVTATALEYGASAVQLEIAARWRSPITRADDGHLMYAALCDLVQHLNT